jgi:hypothetical protein
VLLWPAGFHGLVWAELGIDVIELQSWRREAVNQPTGRLFRDPKSELQPIFTQRFIRADHGGRVIGLPALVGALLPHLGRDAALLEDVSHPP